MVMGMVVFQAFKEEVKRGLTLVVETAKRGRRTKEAAAAAASTAPPNESSVDDGINGVDGDHKPDGGKDGRDSVDGGVVDAVEAAPMPNKRGAKVLSWLVVV